MGIDEVGIDKVGIDKVGVNPCWCRLLLSFYKTRERSTRTRTIFCKGGNKFGPPGPIFASDQIFVTVTSLI